MRSLYSIPVTTYGRTVIVVSPNAKLLTVLDLGYGPQVIVDGDQSNAHVERTLWTDYVGAVIPDGSGEREFVGIYQPPPQGGGIMVPLVITEELSG